MVLTELLVVFSTVNPYKEEMIQSIKLSGLQYIARDQTPLYLKRPLQ